MFSALAFLFIVFIYVPIHLICDAFSDDLKPSERYVKEHNRRVKFEDKMDNDYGYIVEKKDK